MATEVIMPELGESVIEGTIGRWLKSIGDTVDEYEPLLEVETDKVDTEVPAPASGTLLATYVEPGEVVQAGTLIGYIGAPDEEVPDSPGGGGDGTQAQPQTEPAPALAQPEQPAQAASGNGGRPSGVERPSGPRISPVVANIAAEHGVSEAQINQIAGSGRDGRVTKADMLAYVETLEAGPEPAPARTAPSQPAAPAPAGRPAAPADHSHAAPPSIGQPGEVVPLSKMRRRIAEHMVESKLKTAPHVTTVFECDLSTVVKHRAAHKADFAARGINLTFTAYFMAAMADALREHPMVNSRWTDEGVHLYRDVNIGMAVAIDEGLIVPVIHHADERSLAGLARQVNDLAIRARDGNLTPDEVQGGTFTLTNHGVSGSLFATPIINQPQTGIMGVGAIQKRVVVVDPATDAIGVRPMVYLTLTFDHRVLDGAAADFFVASIKDTLENWS